MYLITPKGLESYKIEYDPQMLYLLNTVNQKIFNDFQSHRWHMNSVEKRYVHFMLYRRMINQTLKAQTKVIDVGSGINGLLPFMATNLHYQLIDPGIDPDPFRKILPTERTIQVSCADWADWKPDLPEYDIVIANDLFPNVDQRLKLFLLKFLPICREICLSLTMYDYYRSYRVQRLDAEEQLTILAWNSKQVYDVLKHYEDRIIEEGDLDLEGLPIVPAEDSIFANGRKVIIVRLKGNLWEG